MKKILPVTALLLCACGTSPPPMTNDQIIAATKQCTNAGLRAVPLITIDVRVRVVQCEPKETTQ